MIDVIPTNPNEAPIETMLVFLSTDKDGNHGICSGTIAGIHMPLVTSKMRIAETMKPIAEDIARETGMKIELVHFSRIATMWQTNPNLYKRDA